ncbi:MAG: O-antigen ligase family protein [Epsilonproteobacteria bacterium]|nr:O-antigen ligase family protein [Campylobacterota bacterium]
MIRAIKNLFLEITANKMINYLLILFAFTFPLSPKKSTVVLVVLIFVWIVEGQWKYKLNILYESRPFRYYFGFIIFIGVSLLWSETLYGGFVKHYPSNAVVAYVRMYLFGFMLVPIMLTSMRMQYGQWIISAFLTAMFISEITSWAVYMEWIQINGVHADDPSPFMHHSLYSVFLAVTIFVLMRELFKIHNTFTRVLIVFFILSALTNLFLNGGRLGQLAFFVALAVYIFLKFRVTFRTIILSIASIGIIFLLAYKISPIFHMRANNAIESLEQASEGQFATSWGSRIYALIVAKDVVLEHPLLGAGVGAAKKEFIEKAQKYPQGGLVNGFWHMHNQYMQILLDTGIVGLFLFFLFLYVFLKIPLKNDERILLYVFIAIYLVGFIGEPLFWNQQPFLLFNFFVGLFLLMGVENTRVAKGLTSR